MKADLQRPGVITANLEIGRMPGSLGPAVSQRDGNWLNAAANRVYRLP